ncbi:DUF1853 family protein [Microbulbifer bruguierae]|uniref:DUF1853 family protein n=1 Tax=Microbulbifer bruguierae TaxID=3029061 RepID=A0ABY8NB78_9GAMM|nr:DUF1853 family protein [Microbulbifer bruguierae]WGL16163.1 DUF1853 family protein [Microbulbifer bruguierae]
MTETRATPYTPAMTSHSPSDLPSGLESGLPSAKPDHWSNLRWTLSAPDIAPEFDLPWLPEQRRRALDEYFATPRVRALLEPRLLHFVQQSSSHRLGVYFENLWAFAFNHHPDYQLLARNLPIRSADKTLGELDFVVRHLPDQQLEHWEVAVKFYLQVESLWVGPGIKDRLDIKLAHMRDHQLPVVTSDSARQVLLSSDISLDRQWTRMPGRLFPMLGDTIPGPPHQHWWSTASTFQQHFASNNWHWCQLPKPCWLALCTNSILPAAPLTPLADIPLTQLTARGPICLAGFQGATEMSRGFVVADNWLARAHVHLPSG